VLGLEVMMRVQNLKSSTTLNPELRFNNHQKKRRKRRLKLQMKQIVIADLTLKTQLRSISISKEFY